MTIRPVWIICAFSLGLAFVAAGGTGVAQETNVPATYGGDLWSRPRLTGDWGGLRDDLAKKGVTLDVDFWATPQGVASGGRENKGRFEGNSEYTLNVDTGKLGLWPGGFLKGTAITNFGTSVNPDAGAILPANFPALLPKPNEETTGLTNLTFMQFFNPHFGIVVGKLDTLGGDDNAFAHNFRSQFLYMGLSVNATLALSPLSGYGGGIVVLPWEGAVITATVVDPSGTITNNDISEAFADGVLVGSEGRFTVKPFGLLGHQTVGFMWSNKQYVSLQQDPSNIGRELALHRFPRLEDPGPVLTRILERFFPTLLVPVQPLNQKNDTWSVYYNFDQYLWSPAGNPTSGIGPFFRFGVSDGNPNPIKYAYNVGIGGKGVVPGRPRDTFGIGWARSEFSKDFLPFLRQQLDLGLKREDAVEMYYNVSVTPWLNVTLDLQVIQPGLTKKLDSTGGNLENMGTAVIPGLRLYARF